MMNSADMIGHKFGLCQIRRTFQSYGKRVQTGPVGLGFRIVLNTHLGIFLGDGRDDAAVETTREQYTVRHVAHQLALHCIFEGIVDGLDRGGIILHSVVLHPVATIVPFLPGVDTPVVVAGKEGLVTLALAFEGLELGGDVDGAISIVADVEGDDANGISGDEEFVALLIVEHKGKDTTEVFEEVDAFLTIEGEDDLAV